MYRWIDTKMLNICYLSKVFGKMGLEACRHVLNFDTSGRLVVADEHNQPKFNDQYKHTKIFIVI